MDQTIIKQFICMKWGTLYGIEYLNRLYRMVRRHTTGPIRFVCLTDDAEGADPEIECYDCPTIAIPHPVCNGGWRKLSLYGPSEHLNGITGDWLYLDMDVVVTGSLDPFFSYKPQEPFVVMQNWTQPGKGIGNTSCYRFRVGHDRYLLDNLIDRQDEILKTYRNSQTYISREIKQIAFWPDEWCVLFKVQCLPPWPIRFWKTPFLPPSARVVAFPGVPNPHEALHGQWPTSPMKKLYKSIRPTPWIAQAWGESES